MTTFLLAAAAAFALAVNAQINAADESQVTIDTQGQFEELRDLVHAQALRIAQLEAQLVDTKQRRLKSAPARMCCIQGALIKAPCCI